MSLLELATLEDLAGITALYTKCKNKLAEQGILQWGEWGGNYPDEGYVRRSISLDELFLYRAANAITGSVVLNTLQPEEWSTLNWSKGISDVLVVHALAVDPSFQGKGYGKIILSLCEEHARISGYKMIRLDSFEKNTVSNRLYAKNGYRLVGSVFFDAKPEGNTEYLCYEKILNKIE